MSSIEVTNATLLGAYRDELIKVGIDDPMELAELVRDAAKYLLSSKANNGARLAVSLDPGEAPAPTTAARPTQWVSQ
jgi:hypothetical protein